MDIKTFIVTLILKTFYETVKLLAFNRLKYLRISVTNKFTTQINKVEVLE